MIFGWHLRKENGGGRKKKTIEKEYYHQHCQCGGRPAVVGWVRSKNPTSNMFIEEIQTSQQFEGIIRSDVTDTMGAIGLVL